MHACPVRGAPYTRAFMAVRDYYEVLGVTRTANAEEIRRAHRKLALQYHPDRNKEKSAATRFAEIQQAYEVLSDDEKRKQYDDFIRIGGTPEAFAGGAGAAGAGAGSSPSGQAKAIAMAVIRRPGMSRRRTASNSASQPVRTRSTGSTVRKRSGSRPPGPA